MRFTDTCSNTCGFGTQNWKREKTIIETNNGTCENSKANGTEVCFDCDEIGKSTFRKQL